MIRIFPFALAAVYITQLLLLVLGSGTYIADLYLIYLLLCIDPTLVDAWTWEQEIIFLIL